MPLPVEEAILPSGKRHLNMLWWFARKTASAVLKTSLVAGAAAAFSVYATPDLQWVDSHVGTGLARVHDGKATALDAVQSRIPISQIANVARSTDSIVRIHRQCSVILTARISPLLR